MQPRVYVTRKWPGEMLSALDQFEVVTWNSEDKSVSHDMLVAQARGMHGILCTPGDTVDSFVMDAAGGLRIISNIGDTVDNIDVEAATQRGIMVTNTPEVPAESTADVLFGLMVSVARHFPDAQRWVIGGGWRDWAPQKWFGKDIFHRTMGIVGFNRLGQAVAKRAQGFSMRVIILDKDKAAGPAPGIEFKDLQTLLRESDFVVVTADLTPDNYHLISDAEFGMMKQSAIVISAGSGKVIDQNALVRALVEKRIWGAGLEAFENEPVSPLEPVIKLENVIAIPRLGVATPETLGAMINSAVNNMVMGLTGETPHDLVNPHVTDVIDDLTRAFLPIGVNPQRVVGRPQYRVQ